MWKACGQLVSSLSTPYCGLNALWHKTTPNWEDEYRKWKWEQVGWLSCCNSAITGSTIGSRNSFRWLMGLKQSKEVRGRLDPRSGQRTNNVWPFLWLFMRPSLTLCLSCGLKYKSISESNVTHANSIYVYLPWKSISVSHHMRKKVLVQFKSSNVSENVPYKHVSKV